MHRCVQQEVLSTIALAALFSILLQKYYRHCKIVQYFCVVILFLDPPKLALYKQALIGHCSLYGYKTLNHCEKCCLPVMAIPFGLCKLYYLISNWFDIGFWLAIWLTLHLIFEIEHYVELLPLFMAVGLVGFWPHHFFADGTCTIMRSLNTQWCKELVSRAVLDNSFPSSYKFHGQKASYVKSEFPVILMAIPALYCDEARAAWAARLA